MGYTAQQLVTSFSIIFLLTLIAVAGYCLQQIRFLSLPIPTVLAAFTLALPPVAGFSLATVLKADTVNRHGQRSARRAISSSNKPFAAPLFAVLLLTIYETVIATMSATYMGPPNSLTCGLEAKWTALFRAKESESIKSIQDALECCGFRTVVDRAFPFPAKGVTVDACHVRYDRDKACFVYWRQQEQKIAGLMLMVALFTFVWKIAVVVVPFMNKSSWVNSLFHPSGAAATGNSEESRHPVGFIEERDVYTDEPSGEAAADRLIGEEPESLLDEDGDETPRVENPRVQQLPPLSDRAVWEA